jgi:hypothetical protein
VAALALSVLTLRPPPAAAEEPKAKPAAAEKKPPPRTPPPAPKEKPKKDPKNSAKPPDVKADKVWQVAGRVVSPDNKPVTAEWALVTVQATRRAAEKPRVLAQGKTDARGRFRARGQKPAPGDALVTLARAEGYGLGWQYVEPKSEAVVRLAPAQVVRGRLIDLQGHPAAGVTVHLCRLGDRAASGPGPYRLRVREATDTLVAEELDLSLEAMTTNDIWNGVRPRQPLPALRFLEPPAKLPFWPAAVTTDRQGRFTFRGVPQNQGLGLQVRDPRYAVQALDVRARPGEKPAEVTLVLAQARVLEGRVTDADTGKPLPHARLRIPAPRDPRLLNLTVFLDVDDFQAGEVDWRGRRTVDRISSTLAFLATAAAGGDELPGIDVRADKDGRYKVPLFLADSYTVEASGPSGEPYFSQTRSVNWPKAAARRELNLALTRGVWVKGTVTEVPAAKPVAGARVDFWAPGLKLPAGARFPRPRTTGADGRFQALLPAGSWQVVVNAVAPEYVYEKVAAAKLLGEKPARVLVPGRRVLTLDAKDRHFFYPDGRAALDLKPRAAPQHAAVRLRRVTLTGQLVSPDGRPPARAVMLYRQAVPQFSTPAPPADKKGDRVQLTPVWSWHPTADEPSVVPVEVRGGKFALPVRDPAARYRLHFLDAPKKAGAVFEVSAREARGKPAAVQLVACGSARARFLDDKGRPLAKYRPQVWLLLPPGPHPDSFRYWLQSPRIEEKLKAAEAVFRGSVTRSRGGPAPGPLYAPDQVWLGHADPLHYGKAFATDAKGNINFPALIAGATYRIALPDGKAKDFTVDSGKAVDLSNITVRLSAPPPKPQPKGTPKPVNLK